MTDFSKTELEAAYHQITSLIGKCEKARMKLREGTPQSSLLSNRLKALYISSSLITREGLINGISVPDGAAMHANAEETDMSLFI